MTDNVLGAVVQGQPYRWTVGYAFRTQDLVNGGSYTMLQGVGHVTFTGSAGVATYTVALPATPLDGERRSIAFDKAVTTLTISSSHTVVVAPTSASAGDSFEWIFQKSTGKWLTYSAKVSGGTGGGHTIEDEGVALTQRSTLNFVGSGVTVTDTGTKTLVTIAGSAVGGNIEGGTATSIYGGTTPLDGGAA